MLLSFTKFGGIAPRVLDPALLPENRSQIAQNCRFDQGGIVPLKTDLLIVNTTHVGQQKTIFLYYNSPNSYFFAWSTDVNATKAPLPNDSFNRVFYTEAGELRVTDKNLFSVGGTSYPMTYLVPSPPAPGSACTISGTPSGSDPTLLETRGYVYTFVNSYGEEGPPSPVSNLLSIYDGNTVSITGMATAPAAKYDVTKKRIYRLNQASGGQAQYQFVAEIAVATTTYSDTTLDSGLGEVLASTEWDGPPTGIEGLIALPNGVMAGFVDNILCLSVQKFPHAWPVSYQKTTDRDIVGLGSFGTTVVVLTQGSPYVVVGNDPANTSMEKVNGRACLSKRGIVQAGDVVCYPSPEGIEAIGPNVFGEVITASLMTPDQWIARYNPSTISAYYWQGKYVGFYEKGLTKAGFLLDLKTGDLKDIDLFATAGYNDPIDGSLYLWVGNSIVSFNAGATYRSKTYLTRRMKHQKTSFGALKVIANAYPVTVDVLYPKVPFGISLTVPSSDPVRVPTMLIDETELRFTGNLEISAAFLASTMEEIPL